MEKCHPGAEAEMDCRHTLQIECDFVCMCESKQEISEGTFVTSDLDEKVRAHSLELGKFAQEHRHSRFGFETA